jgi:hypothetical protein
VDGSYLDLLSGSRRRKVRRLRPRLEADSDGDVRVVDHRIRGNDLERAIDGFLAMEAAGWKGVDGGAMSHHAGHADFFREVCRRFADAGSLQFRALRAGSRTIAYQCNLLAGDTVFGFKTTFDEAFRRYSPGVVLVMHTIGTLHTVDRLEVYNPCLDTKATSFHDLFPDRRGLADALVCLGGPLGAAATRLTPGAAAVYRRAGEIRRSVEDRLRPRPAGRL